MKKTFCIALLVMCACLSAGAQAGIADSLKTATRRDGTAIGKYRRSSLYSVLISHSSAPYGNEISQAFLSIPVPDKFNDHNLSVRRFESSMKRMKNSGKAKSQANDADIASFLKTNDVPRSLVAKWFNRDSQTGAFNIDLVQERGYYDASQADIAAAQHTERNLSILGDAGEELIGNTYMIVNDITFADKGQASATAASAIRLGGAIAGMFLGSSVSNLTDVAAEGVNQIDGFKVYITTYLFRLNWNSDISGEFYTTCWIDSTSLDPAKKELFESSPLFSMSYVGQTSTTAENLASKYFSKFSKEAQMLKVCARAVDKSLVELQRAYEEFRVKVPIYKINEDKTVEVQIGLKEGVNEKCKYEVLMATQDIKGHVVYKRVGMLRPIKGSIWDNRFGALEEAQALASSGGKVEDKEADGADVNLNSTRFEVLSGANEIMPGCLVREASIAN